METTSTALEIERLERKVDMSLDDIIKMQKKLQRKVIADLAASSMSLESLDVSAFLHVQARKSTRKPKRKNAYQESVASHPSVVQQGRFAKSRAWNRDFDMFAPKNTAQKISYRIDSMKLKKRNRKRASKTSRTSGEAMRNIKVLVSHDLRRRLLSSTRRSGVAARLSARPETMENGGFQPNLQTLDSRFARLSRSRQASSSLMQRPGRDGF